LKITFHVQKNQSRIAFIDASASCLTAAFMVLFYVLASCDREQSLPEKVG
jgi:hypothetical protein